MTFQITNEETGRTFTFTSEEAYERANWWYNTTEKDRIQEFCEALGIDLTEAADDPYFRSGKKLVRDWADVAMEAYAKAS